MAKVVKKRKKYQSRYAKELGDKVALDNRVIDELLNSSILAGADQRDAHRWFYALYQGNIDSMEDHGLKYMDMPRIVQKGEVPKNWARCNRCKYRTNVKKDNYGHYCQCSINFDESGEMKFKVTGDGCSEGVEGEQLKVVC